MIDNKSCDVCLYPNTEHCRTCPLWKQKRHEIAVEMAQAIKAKINRRLANDGSAGKVKGR